MTRLQKRDQMISIDDILGEGDHMISFLTGVTER